MLCGLLGVIGQALEDLSLPISISISLSVEGEVRPSVMGICNEDKALKLVMMRDVIILLLLLLALQFTGEILKKDHLRGSRGSGIIGKRD